MGTAPTTKDVEGPMFISLALLHVPHWWSNLDKANWIMSYNILKKLP